MNWYSLDERKPNIGDYVFVKKGDSRSLAIWHTPQGFIFFDSEDVSSEQLWSPALTRGYYEDIPGTRGELNYILTGFFDEDGNQWKG